MQYRRFQSRRLTWTALCLLIVSGTVWFGGCTSKESKEETSAKPKAVISFDIKVLIIDDLDLVPIIDRQWRARTENEIQVIPVSWKDFASSGFDTHGSDVVVYPSFYMGDLIQNNVIAEIEPDNLDDDEFNRKEILYFHRNTLVHWGEAVMGVSLGEAAPVTLWRSDVLEQVGKEPPTTWNEFSEVVQSIQSADLGDLPSAVGVPLSDHWASQMLMARAASSVRSKGKYSSLFDVSNMKPLIDSDPFFQALNGWNSDLETVTERLSPEAVLEQFANGELAVAITPVRGIWLNEIDSDSFPDTVVTALPGSKRLYDFSQQKWVQQSIAGEVSRVPLIACDGSMASVVMPTQAERNAISFLKWLADKKISVLIGPSSIQGGVSRKSHLGNPSPWLSQSFPANASREYAEVIRQDNDNQLSFIAFRAPARDQYLDLLDNAVIDVLMNGGNAVEQLSATALRWNELTEQLGKDAQRTAYRRSEGLRN